MSGAGTSFVPNGKPLPGFTVQRTPGCVCGGNCPRCTTAQTKLEVNEPGDLYEREADYVAEQAARMPEAGVLLQVDEGEEEDLLQMKPLIRRRVGGDVGGSEAPPIVHEVLRSPGRPLNLSTRQFMESRFGHDLDRVRIHDDSKAAKSAQAVSAVAYAFGHDIVFSSGLYAPGTRSGRRLLAHELIHVIQQASAMSSPPISRSIDSGLSSSSGGGGGRPEEVPDCVAVMGGRQVEHWLAGGILGQYHTYINFKLDEDHYWLIEAGPLPDDPNKVGAWAKQREWENRGNRVMSRYESREDCIRAKECLLNAQATYHSKRLPYDAVVGSNSNSFTEHMTYKCPVLGIFHRWSDHQWDYWRRHSRPL